MRRVIGELGLRFPASQHIDPEAHAGRLALLCRDLADVPVDALEWAADEWAKESAFLPKASELRSIARRYAAVDGKPIPTELGAYCDYLNRRFSHRWYFIVEEGERRCLNHEPIDYATWRARRAQPIDDAKPHPMNDYGRVQP